MSDDPFHQYRCPNCGMIYDEAEGLPVDGIPPGTRWEDLPHDWFCPNCAMKKERFKPLQ
ncbi:MAG: rubredoxin [Pseudomonadota bacterium]